MNVKTKTDQDWAKDVKTDTLSKVLLEKNQTSKVKLTAPDTKPHQACPHMILLTCLKPDIYVAKTKRV